LSTNNEEIKMKDRKKTSRRKAALKKKREKSVLRTTKGERKRSV
jgi:hypothetical protein